MPGHVSAPTYFDMVRSYMLSSPLKAMLVTTDFTFDYNLHEFRSSVFNEAVGAGYAAGGVGLESVDVLLHTDSEAVELVADDVEFGVMTASDVSLLIVYLSTGAATTDRIVAAYSFTPVTRTTETFTFLWSTRSAADPSRGLIARFNY